MILKAGSSSKVELPFTANPQPDVTMGFNGGAVNDAKRITHVTETNLITFVLEKCEQSDAGEYGLTITNQNGSATATIKVIVLGESSKEQNTQQGLETLGYL